MGWMRGFALFLCASATLADDSIFADGFEVCEATHWTAATGLPDCSAELTCTTPDPGEACAAGRLLDVETSDRLCSSPVVTTGCTSGLQGGPCELQLRVYDAVALLSDPGSAMAIAASEILVDGCGRFRISGFDAPGTGYGAMVARDDGETLVQHLPSADVRPIASNVEIEGIRLYVVRQATDEAWTETAGSPFETDTFADLGVVVPIFLHAGAPVAGVQIRVNGSADTGHDYYFSDSDPAHRSVVASGLSSTGADGSGILVTTSLDNKSGAGAEPLGCTWPTVLIGSTPGIVVVKELGAQVDGQPGVPCP